MIFRTLAWTIELYMSMTKYIIGESFSSGGATLYKNPSDQWSNCVKASDKCKTSFLYLDGYLPSSFSEKIIFLKTFFCIPSRIWVIQFYQLNHLLKELISQTTCLNGKKIRLSPRGKDYHLWVFCLFKIQLFVYFFVYTKLYYLFFR